MYTEGTGFGSARQRVAWRWAVALVVLTLTGGPTVASADPSAATAPLRRDDLVGTWRLIGIEILAAGRSRSDPFYGANCSGMLIYDRSGSMSVQIMGRPRPALATPSVRDPDATQDLRRAGAVLATYYAYFGTWDFDAATSQVTHHVAGSLYPAEIGLSYSQEVTILADRMTFTFRQRTAAGEILHRKVWERVARGSGSR